MDIAVALGVVVIAVLGSPVAGARRRVSSGGDVRVQVSAFGDLRVQKVSAFADSRGDVRIQDVSVFPGADRGPGDRGATACARR